MIKGVRPLAIGFLVGGLTFIPSIGVAASTSQAADADAEEAYVRGALAGASNKRVVELDALTFLRSVQIGTELLRRGCAAAHPELASALAADWAKSRLGSASFSVNGLPVSSESMLRGLWGKQIAPTGAFHGLAECRFFASYLQGTEEALPESIRAWLGVPVDQSPYAAGSKSPVLRVLIGHAGPTSGAIAHLGQDNENGTRLAIEELNKQALKIQGKPVRFMLMPVNDEADPLKGQKVANKLVDAGVKAVIGHLNSGISIPTSRIYMDAGIPMISPASTNPWLTRQGFRTVFRLLLDDEKLGQGLAKYARDELAVKRVAIIRDGTPYGNGLAWAFDAEVYRSGLEVTNRELTSDKATEFTDILQRIKESNPDLVFFGGMDAVAGPMLKQMHALGIAAKFMGGDGICSPGLADLAEGALGDDQVICAEAGGTDKAHEKLISAFRARFKSRFSKPVEVYAPYAYDATMLVVQAMVHTQSVEPAAYLPYLRSARGFEGVTGPYSFDERGDPIEGQFTIYTYRNAKRVELRVQRFAQRSEDTKSGEVPLTNSR